MSCAGDEKTKQWAERESRKHKTSMVTSKVVSKIESKESSSEVDTSPTVEEDRDSSEFDEDSKKELKENTHIDIYKKLQKCREDTETQEQWDNDRRERYDALWNEYVKTAQRNEQLSQQVNDLMVRLNTQGAK